MYNKIVIVLIFVINTFAAANDLVTCTLKDQFILGLPNVFINDLAIQKCNSDDYQNTDEICQCATHNKKIIGPYKEDYPKVEKSIALQNKDKLKLMLEKSLLSTIQTFTQIDSRYSFMNAASSCSLKKINEIKCKNENSLIARLTEYEPNFIKDIVDSAQCEIEISYGASKCSGNKERILKDKKELSCISPMVYNEIKLKSVEDNFYSLFSLLNNKEDNQELHANLKKHPIINMILDDENLSNKLNLLAKDIPKDKQNNDQLLRLISEGELNTLITKKFEQDCSKRFENIETTLCMDVDKLFETNTDQTISALNQKNDEIDHAKENVKEKRRENFLDYQHELYFYCSKKEIYKTPPLLSTQISSSNQFINQDFLSETLDMTKLQLEKQVESFEENICRALIDENGKPYKMDELLSRNNCPQNLICSDLQQYVEIIGETPPLQTADGNYIFKHESKMSDQMKLIYGLEIGQEQSFEAKQIVALNDSPKLQELEKIKSQALNESIGKTKKIANSDGKQEKPMQNFIPPQIIVKNPISQNNTRSIASYQQTSSTTGVSPSTTYIEKSSEDVSTSNDLVKTNKKPNSLLDKTVNDQVMEIKDDMITTLKDQLDEMRDLASKAIDINNKFIPTPIIPAMGENIGEDQVIVSKGNNDINNNFVIDTARESNEVRNPSSLPNIKSTDFNNGSGSMPAFINVKSEESTKTNKVDEIEVFFKPGEKPSLDLLNESDYNRIVTYLKEKKPFILTKKYNINGREEIISAKIVPLPGNKFEISSLTNKAEKSELSLLQKEILEALKLAKKDSSKTKLISLNHSF